MYFSSQKMSFARQVKNVLWPVFHARQQAIKTLTSQVHLIKSWKVQHCPGKLGPSDIHVYPFFFNLFV